MSELYVHGLPRHMTISQLTQLFARHGTVISARIASEWYTGQSRGFGFVKMSTAADAQAAIAALNGRPAAEGLLTVTPYKPRVQDQASITPHAQ